MEVITLILPVLGLVLLGQVFLRTGLVVREDWSGVETLTYKVLIPALIINAIYKSDLSLGTAAPFIFALYGTVAILGGLSLTLRLFLGARGPSDPVLSTLFQTTTRWNAFIPLPIAAGAFGDPGFALIAIAMAFLVPAVNVGNIMVLSILGSRNWSIVGVAKTVLLNPLVIGSGIGLLLNMTGIQLPVAAERVLFYLAGATLAVGLLCVGAGFDLKRLMLPGLSVGWSVLLKNFGAPLLFWGFAQLLDLTNVELVCGMLVVAAPAAANGFIVARKMGGDAPLYAGIMTWQLVASIGTVTVILAQTL